MTVNITSVDLIKQASKGAKFFSTASYALLGGNLSNNLKKEKIERLSINIERLLKTRKKMTVPEVMKEFNVNIAEAIEAINLLKERGIIQEID
jgi:predicted HTH transcriptional regulator